jgi:hypothetical protein
MWHANARPAGDTGQSKSSRRGAAAGSPAAARRGTAGPRYGDLPAVPFAQRLQHRLHGGAFRAQVTTDHPRPAERRADLHAQLRAGGQQPHLPSPSATPTTSRTRHHHGHRRHRTGAETRPARRSAWPAGRRRPESSGSFTLSAIRRRSRHLEARRVRRGRVQRQHMGLANVRRCQPRHTARCACNPIAPTTISNTTLSSSCVSEPTASL